MPHSAIVNIYLQSKYAVKPLHMVYCMQLKCPKHLHWAVVLTLAVSMQLPAASNLQLQASKPDGWGEGVG